VCYKCYIGYIVFFVLCIRLKTWLFGYIGYKSTHLYSLTYILQTISFYKINTLNKLLNMKQINFPIDSLLHTRLKTYLAKHDIILKDFLPMIIDEQISNNKTILKDVDDMMIDIDNSIRRKLTIVLRRNNHNLPKG